MQARVVSDVFHLAVGELIVSAGLVALVLYRFRSHTTDRSTLYFGLSALIYGLREIAGWSALPSTLFPSVRWHTIESSLTLVVGIPFVLFVGCTIGRAYQWFINTVVIANVLLAIIGAVKLIQGAPAYSVSYLNKAVVVATLVGWCYIGIFPRIPIDREVRALRMGLLVLGFCALYQNLSVIGVLPRLGFIEPFGMVVLLGTFLYVSASRSLRLETNLIAIRKELDIARKIQSQLLPALDGGMAGVEIHARYSPAGSVAGDFYDVLCDGRGVGVLIADVSGHGVPAALSASMLKVALKAQAGQMTSPAKVLAGLNRTMSGALGDQFITAAYVYFDAARGELQYAGAGHPPVLVWSAMRKKVECLEENGVFLGPFPWAKYSELRAPFEPGDRCLLFTDGLVEAENRGEEEFGAARLRDFLAVHADEPADAACSALLDEVTSWSGTGPDSQQDDITFVVVELQPQAVSSP